MNENRNTLLKTYTYTTMAIGICLVSILTLPFAIIFGIVADVILGLIFLSSAEEVEFV